MNGDNYNDSVSAAGNLLSSFLHRCNWLTSSASCALSLKVLSKLGWEPINWKPTGGGRMGNCIVPNSSVIAMEGAAVLGEVTGDDRNECGGVISGFSETPEYEDCLGKYEDRCFLLVIEQHSCTLLLLS